MRNPHQSRTLTLIEGTCGPNVVGVEKAVLHTHLPIDCLLSFTQEHPPPRALGLLRSIVAERVVALEHFSRPPDRFRFATAVTKLWALLREHYPKTGAMRPKRPPLLLLLTAGHPRTALKMLPAREIVPGLYLRDAGGEGEICYLNVRGLAGGPGTGLLKLLDHRPANRAEPIVNLRHDPELDILDKEAIMEVIMNNPQVFDQEERRLSARELYESGVAEGMERGTERGMEKGMVTVLALLADDRLGRPLSEREAQALSALVRERGERVAYEALASARGPSEVASLLSAPRDRQA